MKPKHLSCKSFQIFFLFLTVFVITSCIPQKKIELLQDAITVEKTYKLTEKVPLFIKPNDELYIRVSSFDDVAFNFFNNQTSSNYLNYNNELSLSLITFTVNDSGAIDFPILGHVQMEGLTINEATKKLKDLLSEYFNQPTVIIKVVNKKISVFGEVQLSGSFTYTNDRITIFEAISMAGDVTPHGNLKDVYLVRSENDSIMKIKMDLTADQILTSKYYYLLPNDVIYVKPRPSLTWNIVSVPITLVLTTLTTALLIFDYTR
ncbi:MAG: polysaccharide biosynthesis/export family protein [Bacteroidales bacterium]|nr:polysaccharide biosynthesis/export family protein [Bacteroidales bacterium]